MDVVSDISRSFPKLRSMKFGLELDALVGLFRSLFWGMVMPSLDRWQWKDDRKWREREMEDDAQQGRLWTDHCDL